MKKMRKGDQVVVIAGNDKGKKGEVLSVLNDRIVVQGVNMRKKHMKRRSEQQSSQIIEMEMAIHISNVSFCDESGKRVSVHTRRSKESSELFYLVKGKETLLRKIK